jgi:prepilin-type N-terminal cleavage/methylation domain-containing protein
MNKTKLLKLLLVISKNNQQGLSLTELIVAIVMGSIVLAVSASGFINLFRMSQDVEAKSINSSNLNNALNYIDNDIKSARAITRADNCNSSGDVTSTNCLVLTYPSDVNIDGNDCTITTPQIYYGYQDISTGAQTWLKPGILKRKVFCTSTAGGSWQVIADGLISINEDNPAPTCNQNDVNWDGSWNTTVYGDDGSGKGGFRFCLQQDDTDPTSDPNNRLVRIFLYGHIITNSANNMISVDTVGVAKVTED